MAPHRKQHPEQRLDAQRILRTEVTLQLASGQVQCARSYDLSLGGMALITQVQLAPGTLAQLEFALMPSPGEVLRVRLRAHLVYCQPCNGGCKSGWQFIDPASQQLAYVGAWLAAG